MADQIFDGNLGWRPSSPEKIAYQQREYLWSAAVPKAVDTVNVINTLPNEFRTWYNQGNHNSCVAYSSAQAMAFMNWKQIGLRNYDAWTMYCKICQLDIDPQTSCQNDVGAFTWASGDCLKNLGPHLNGKWVLDEGVQRYLWARPGTNGVDDIRSAISYSTDIANSQIVCIGMNWYNFKLKQDENNNWWFNKHDNWGNTVGGHQIGIFDAVDSADAVGFVNTWGNNWPKKVYMHYDDLAWVLNKAGEAMILVDRSFNVPIPPEPEPDPEPTPDPEPILDKITVGLSLDKDGSTYKNDSIELTKV